MMAQLSRKQACESVGVAYVALLHWVRSASGAGDHGAVPDGRGAAPVEAALPCSALRLMQEDMVSWLCTLEGTHLVLSRKLAASVPPGMMALEQPPHLSGLLVRACCTPFTEAVGQMHGMAERLTGSACDHRHPAVCIFRGRAWLLLRGPPEGWPPAAPCIVLLHSPHVLSC